MGNLSFVTKEWCTHRFSGVDLDSASEVNTYCLLPIMAKESILAKLFTPSISTVVYIQKAPWKKLKI